MTNRRLMWVLGLAGLLPFVVASSGLWLFDGLLQALSQRTFILYSLAILCFLAGTLWGETLPGSGQVTGQGAAILISNGIVVFAVLAMLTAQPLISTVLLMLGHLAQLWYERSKPGREAWYTQLRTVLTGVATLSHLLFAAGLMAGLSY